MRIGSFLEEVKHVMQSDWVRGDLRQTAQLLQGCLFMVHGALNRRFDQRFDRFTHFFYHRLLSTHTSNRATWYEVGHV